MGRRSLQRDPGITPWIVAGFALALALVLGVIGAVVVPRALHHQPARPRASAAPSHSPTPAPSPVLLPDNSGDPAPTAAGLIAALSGPLTDRRLGGRVSYSVVDAETGARLT
ncbi:MAG: hypothetical protein WCB04_01240, partial [Mycobacteriales bacterium]